MRDYGVVWDPERGIAYVRCSNGKFVKLHVTVQDILDELDCVSDGFFSFIGISPEEARDELMESPHFVPYYIMSLHDWSGFCGDVGYLDADTVMEILEEEDGDGGSV